MRTIAVLAAGLALAGAARADTIRRNLRSSWTVDRDPFLVNQLGHPYQGSMYHGFARASGLSFWESLGYTFAGSAFWEIAGETTTLSQLLVDFAGYRKSDVTVVLNLEATKARITGEIDRVVKESDKDPLDHFILMFAGHGLPGRIDDRDSNIFLAPSDASTAENTFYSTGTEVDRLAAGTHLLEVRYRGVAKQRQVEIRPGSPLLVNYSVIRGAAPKKDDKGVGNVVF